VLRNGGAALAVVLAGCGTRESASGATPSESELTTDTPVETGTKRTRRATTDPEGKTATETAVTASVETPAPGECAPASPPTPAETDGGLEPMSYPEYPDSLTRASAPTFVEEYERSYRHNEFLAEHFDSGYDQLLVHLGVENVTEREGGYLVRVDGGRLFADDERSKTATETPRPSGRIPFVTWFLLSDRFALRSSVDRGLPDDADPDFSGAETIFCEEPVTAARTR
jgi:hypothetical protein